MGGQWRRTFHDWHALSSCPADHENFFALGFSHDVNVAIAKRLKRFLQLLRIIAFLLQAGSALVCLYTAFHTPSWPTYVRER
jgi:hypothetical protein